MAWKIVIVGKSRDSEGRIAVDCEYRDTVSNVKQEARQFVFERGTSQKMAVAQMRAFGLVAFELRAIDDTLDSATNVGDEVPL